MKTPQTQDSWSGCRAQVQEKQSLEVTLETHAGDSKQREVLLQKKLDILGIQHQRLTTMLSAELTPTKLAQATEAHPPGRPRTSAGVTSLTLSHESK